MRSISINFAAVSEVPYRSLGGQPIRQRALYDAVQLHAARTQLLHRPNLHRSSSWLTMHANNNRLAIGNFLLDVA